MSRLNIVSPSSAEYRFLADITEPSKTAYAQKWGTSCYFPVHTGTGEEMMWQRIQFMREGLEGHEWALFMGADTIITNQNVDPRAFTTEDADLVIAVDMNGLQSDVMFIRNCDATKTWLDEVAAQRGVERCEQDAMSKILGQTASYSAYRSAFHEIERIGLENAHESLLNETNVRVRVEPKKNMNSTAADWTPGDFIFHASAMERAARIATLQRLSEEYA